jgi:hypothetical protein
MLDTGRVTVRDVDRVRRRAVLLLGGLAAAMLLAGLLPWVTGGDTTIRLLALPLLLAGLMVAGAAMRVVVVRRPAPVTPVERGCAGCTCGAGSCAAGAGPAPGQPSADG